MFLRQSRAEANSVEHEQSAATRMMMMMTKSFGRNHTSRHVQKELTKEKQGKPGKNGRYGQV